MKMVGPFSGGAKGTQWDCDEKKDINPHINYQPKLHPQISTHPTGDICVAYAHVLVSHEPRANWMQAESIWSLYVCVSLF